MYVGTYNFSLTRVYGHDKLIDSCFEIVMTVLVSLDDDLCVQ